MPHILIVSSGPLCRNPRVLKEADTLGRAGYEVTVATIANIARFETYDDEIMQSAPFRKLALDRISDSPAIRLVTDAERAASWGARKAIRCGIESPFALGPYLALSQMVRRIPADLTIVHTELPFCVGGALLGDGRRVAADFEDWHSRDLLPSARAARPLRLIERQERLLMKRSVYTSAPSHAMAAALSAAYAGAPPVVIPNTFPIQAAPPSVPRKSPPAYFWFSQTIGEGRGLEAFLRGWARTREPSQVVLLGDVSGKYAQGLMQLLPGPRRGLLSFLPITSTEKLPSVIASHDIGLALEPCTPESRDLTATNKIFQYMNAGLAIVATPTAGQREVIANAPDCGILAELDYPDRLADRLDALLVDRSRLTEMAAAARRGAELRYCWEKVAPLLVETVRQALVKPLNPSGT
jgi:glycosyltransferase involved in cell wall biosynthesis